MNKPIGLAVATLLVGYAVALPVCAADAPPPSLAPFDAAQAKDLQRQ